MTLQNRFSFKEEFILKAQTPLIHFQYKEDGATLRATEVKPKLDAFLIKKLNPKNEWYIDRSLNSALNYKMRISVTKKHSEPSEPPRPYYGNSKSTPDKNVYTVFADCKLEIICFIPELLDAIKSNIWEFFTITNFGRMQNKGFGSFTCTQDGKAEHRTMQEIGKILANNAGAKACYCITGYGNRSFTDMFKDITTLYSVMKSGNSRINYHRSYLFEYCHEKMNMGNEKAKLKISRISPWDTYDGKEEPVRHPYTKRNHYNQGDTTHYYVRAMLGVGDHIDYIKGFEWQNRNGREGYFPLRDKDTVKISNKDIARLSSPIMFKIIDGTIYIVAKRIDENIFGKQFTFTNKTTGKSINLSTPDNFDIDAFLDWFVNKYNFEANRRDQRGRMPVYSINKRIETVYKGV